MIKDIASKKTCGGGAGGANTGKLGCLSLFGTPSHMIAFSKGLRIDGTEEWDFDFFADLIQRGKAIPLIDASAFEDVSGEDTYSTNTKGVKRLNLKGLPEYKLMFEEGHEFYREISKLESFKSYDYAIGDEAGNWMLAQYSNGDVAGFSAGHTTPELTKRKSEGGDAESKSILIQFLDRLQWDKNYTILHAEDLSITPQEIPGVNGTEISFVANPASADVIIAVDVVLAADRHSPVEGLLLSDFVVDVNGVSATISLVAEPSPGRYNITIGTAIATNDIVSVNNFSGATNSFIAKSNGVLYRNSVDNTVTAA